METSELLKKVRKIEIKTRGLSNRIFSGEYHSTFKGRGMSFSEVREYAYGDDVKAIDWNVTARFNTPYIKIFEEERELTVMMLVDVSRSAFFGTVNQMKSQMMTEICAVLAFSAINNNDKVGVLFFSDKIEKFIPPKKGKSHVLRIIRELIEFSDESNLPNQQSDQQSPTSAWSRLKNIFAKKSKPEAKTETKAENTDEAPTESNIEQALKYFMNVIKKRSIAFLLSDFMDDMGYEKSLNLVSKKHDFIGIHLHDPLEKDLPNVGLARLKDAETGQTIWVDTSSKNVRKKYKVNFLRNFDYCKKAFAKSGAEHLPIATNQSYVKALISLFKKR